jgi:hypothetical protein
LAPGHTEDVYDLKLQLTISSLSVFPLAVTPLLFLPEMGLMELCKFRNRFSVTFMARTGFKHELNGFLQAQKTRLGATSVLF